MSEGVRGGGGYLGWGKKTVTYYLNGPQCTMIPVIEFNTCSQFHQRSTYSFCALRSQKHKRTLMTKLYFLCFRDLQAQKLYVECWWNWHLIVPKNMKEFILANIFNGTHKKFAFLKTILIPLSLVVSRKILSLKLINHIQMRIIIGRLFQ
jgi:hypothetical protein